MSQEKMRACIVAYVAAWNEQDGAKRRALIEQGCSPDMRFVTAGHQVIGHERLDALMADFHRRRPGDRAVFASAIDIQGHLFRFAGKVEGGKGAPLPDGLDVGECDEDGRILVLLTFVGAEPPKA